MLWIVHTNEKSAANIEPRWMLKYLLLCKIGFWYHGIRTDFMERVFCEFKFDKDLKMYENIILFLLKRKFNDNSRSKSNITVQLSGLRPSISCTRWLAFFVRNSFWQILFIEHQHRDNFLNFFQQLWDSAQNQTN